MALDHLGWIVPDLEAGRRAWERLGFTISRPNRQEGYTGPDGALEPWASANRIVAFEQGYLELIGIVDEAAFNPWTTYLARGAGPHIAAFRVQNADSAYPKLAVEGLDPPVQRRRKAALGREESDGSIDMGFRNIFSQDAHWPEGRYIVIEHETPEAIWQPDMLEHTNGVTGLIQALFVSDDPENAACRIEALKGDQSKGAGWLNKADDERSVAILSNAAFAERFPEAPPPSRPAVAGCLLRVASMAKLERCMKDAGVAVHRSDDGLAYVAGADTAGGLIAFTEGDAP